MDYKKCISVVAALMFVVGMGIVVLACMVVNERRTISVSGNIAEVSADMVSENIPRLSEIAALKEPAEVEEQTGEEVSLLLSSIQKDLKIKIVSSDGKLAKGEAWIAYVRNEAGKEEIYEDTDQDGMIHVQSMKSGIYEVMLEAQEDIAVPKTPARVSVKDNIVYQVVANIRDEIKMESEIDVSLEDTADIEEVDAGVEHAIGQVGTLGIDVSKWNKEIDWQQVKDAGVDYAILRLGYRGSSSGALVEDPYFSQNFINARMHQVKTGVYFFTQALTEAEAIEEASMVVEVLAHSPIEYPVFLDVEGSGGRADGLDATQRTANIKAFCETIENAGYKAGVYANKNWFTNKINTAELQDYTIWLAQYNVSEPDYEGSYHMWQYSSKGSIPGITGFVDMNQSYID